MVLIRVPSMVHIVVLVRVFNTVLTKILTGLYLGAFAPRCPAPPRVSGPWCLCSSFLPNSIGAQALTNLRLRALGSLASATHANVHSKIRYWLAYLSDLMNESKRLLLNVALGFT